MPLNLLAVLVNKSEINISMHSGSIVHISAALNKPIIDILEVEKNNEIDRWIPEISNYKRVELDKLNDLKFEFINHSCFIVTYKDKSLTVDPWLEGSVFTNPGTC